jgi:valyl-tRNA synthetase
MPGRIATSAASNLVRDIGAGRSGQDRALSPQPGPLPALRHRRRAAYLDPVVRAHADVLAEPAIEAVREGRIRIVPERFTRIYYNWMENIRDWCISRQLWWGHRIPVWYCDDCGEMIVAREDPTRCTACASESLRQDPDVLDTWFSSGLWPFSTLGWPEETEDLAYFYPTSVMETAYDIIFFWVARMIMLGLKFMDDVPFRTVYVHGLIRDHEGQKMSKSKGNILDPLDIIDGVDLETLLAKRTEGLMQPHLKPRIEEATRTEFPDGIPAYGTDAMRFTFASLATTGRDISFDLGRVEGYQRFCNKLWNAAGFVFSQLQQSAADDGRSGELTIADRWIRSRLHDATGEFHAAVASFRFDIAAQVLYDFTWHEFCDWYLELTKPVLYAEDAALADQQRSTRATLAHTLGALLRLLHPIMPYITEELWLKLAAQAGFDSRTIMLEAMPEDSDFAPDPQADREVAWIKQFVIGIRQIRGEANIAPSRPLPVLLADASELDLNRAHSHQRYLRKLANLSDIRVIADDSERQGTATALLGEMKILVPLAGLIDVDGECERLTRQLNRAEQDLEKLERKLGNAQFVANAPPEVVSRDKARAAELALKRDQLSAQIRQLRSLAQD